METEPNLTAAEVRHAEAAPRAAMLTGNVLALDALLSDEVVWLHASAKQDAKEALIEQFATDGLRCIRLDHAEQSLRLFGVAALVTGLVEMEVLARRAARGQQPVYCGLGEKAGAVQLVHWQSPRAEPSR